MNQLFRPFASLSRFPPSAAALLLLLRRWGCEPRARSPQALQALRAAAAAENAEHEAAAARLRASLDAAMAAQVGFPLPTMFTTALCHPAVCADIRVAGQQFASMDGLYPCPALHDPRDGIPFAAPPPGRRPRGGHQSGCAIRIAQRHAMR